MNIIVVLGELLRLVTTGMELPESCSYAHRALFEFEQALVSYDYKDFAPITVPVLMTPGIVRHSTTP